MLRNYLLFEIIVTFGQMFGLLFAGEIPRPRGVPISRASLYQTKSEYFSCLDGLKIIKLEQVNDDFCDCYDGSDEPGTSACPNGWFHCTNAGHRPLTIPSSRVNDRVCDCCDGSDEYKQTDGCENKCIDLGREERQQRKTQEELYKKGAAIRVELSSRGKQLKSERLGRLGDLEKRLTEANSIKSEKEVIKKEAETFENEALELYKEISKDTAATIEETNEEVISNREEAEEAFNKYDTNSDGYLDIEELKVDNVFDKDGDGVVSEGEALFFLDEQKQITLELFITVSWPRMKPFLMLESGIFKAPDSETEDIENNKLEIDGESQEAEQPNAENGSEERYDNEEDDVGEGSVVEEAAATQKPEYDPETEKIIELANAARNSYNDAERTVREIEQEIKEIKDQNSKDYGPHEEFAPLDGECFSFDDREYVYKLCVFDRASQQQRSGGAETTLGRWEEWSTDPNNKYAYQKYSHGASCWNGPQRSVIAQMKCGLENKITSVSEPNRCEYLFVFESPAACEPVENGRSHNEQTDDHDEL